AALTRGRLPSNKALCVSQLPGAKQVCPTVEKPASLPPTATITSFGRYDNPNALTWSTWVPGSPVCAAALGSADLDTTLWVRAPEHAKKVMWSKGFLEPTASTAYAVGALLHWS